MQLQQLAKQNPDTTKVSHLWDTHLEPAITKILHNGGPLGAGSWTLIYTLIYNSCTLGGGARELYSKLAPFYRTHTEKIYADAPPPANDDDGAALLVYYYNTQWDRFQRGAKIVDQSNTPYTSKATGGHQWLPVAIGGHRQLVIGNVLHHDSVTAD
ncbi:hypothetical protein B0H12DRAFT_1240248 [Mycena haematopus]|nr:hypothetical protein B0H12DRAFT_1240248 [Mycena haematopus]